MPYRKFGKNDVNINTMKTHPRSEFFIYDSKIYYNNRSKQSGSFSHNVLGDLPDFYSASSGFVSLYEYEIDVPSYGLIDTADLPYRGGATPAMAGFSGASARASLRPPIYPYISKDSSRISLKITETMSGAVWSNEFQYGDLLTASYPQWASIKREYLSPDAIEDTLLRPSASCDDKEKSTCKHNRSYWSLRSILNLYGTLSPHYLVETDYGAGPALGDGGGWNKDTQKLNLIHIPSIFYGKRIRPGTVRLKWFYTGSLIGELRDTKENGELIQVSGTFAGLTAEGDPTSNIGLVAGVVLYNEGFILLTGSWALTGADTSLPNNGVLGLVNPDQQGVTSTRSTHRWYPRWRYWGAGARDNVNAQNTCLGDGGHVGLRSASFSLSFEGETTTQVMTLQAQAPRGKVNYSNNPTFLQHGQTMLKFTSSHVYEESPDRLIKNTVSSSHSDHSASFERQVYISKIAVYDESKNLIGIATLADPVLKKEDQDLTFKLKMDI